MTQPQFSKPAQSGEGPEALFWESDVLDKSYYKGAKRGGFRYYDESNALKYPFYHWVPRWIRLYSRGYVEPYRFHPLALSEQIQRWEPTLSKHISDELVKLELLELSRSKQGKKIEDRPRKSIFVKAMFLAFWKRVLLGLLGIVATNVLSMSISVLVEKLLKILSDKSFNFANTVLLLLAIILCQILDGLFVDNFNFYMYRFVLIVQSSQPVAAFRHGLSHRRSFANNVSGSNALGVCNQVVHSCAPDSECSKNPLYCPARRHQTREMSPKMMTIDFTDSYGTSVLFSSLITITEFITNFVYGIFLMSTKIKVNIWVLYLVGVVFIFLMVVMEILGCYAFGWILYIRDNKACRLSSILNSLSVIRKMFYDDIAANIITQARNDELSLFYIRIFLLYLNIALCSSCINVSFYVMQRYFVKSVNSASLITEIDTSAFVTTFYIYMRIINSMFLIPISIKHIGTSFPSYKRLEKFFKDCSPNFYISDNKYTGSVKTSTNVVPITTQLPKDVVVYYKDATFTWVNTRHDLLNKNYEPLLRNINFELKRGEMAIVTGSKGSGKSNFIKSILGEMTLVGGSMAVVPLHTSMPIFYASQDIFLQQGTIRSNITFGYKFDEQLYNTVLKAVELEYDISTWDKGDLRVVSDNAHSLSGGQRVRMELARAVYAYLVFHKVNKEYNNSQCSFLMCLDALFHGLDPYVSKTIFNNLFNVKTGLLVKDDLSVVLTMSKQTLETCTSSCEPSQFHKVLICDIANEKLEIVSNLHDLVKNKKEEDADHAPPRAKNTGGSHVNGFTKDLLSLCSSGSNTRRGRAEVTKSSYLKSFETFSACQKTGIAYEPHLVYMRPAVALFALSIILIVVVTIMDNVKLVLSTDLSDYITSNINRHKEGKFVDLYEIKRQSNFSLKTMALIVGIIIALSLLLTLSLSMSCITSSRKFHEYCINSIFKYSSAVLKVKNEINQITTYILCDIIMFDDSLSHEFYLLVSSFVLTVIHLVTLFYLIPISIPFVTTAFLAISKGMFYNCLRGSKVIELCCLEATAQLNRNIENATEGPSIYRSYGRDLELLANHAEHNDYKIRSNFAMFYMLTWLSISFNWVFSATTFVILVMPILLDRFTKTKLRVGYFGLALSLSMNVIKSFTKFTTISSTVEIYMCSVERFKYFIPPGAKPRFGKSPNTHEEYLVNPGNKDARGLDKKQLLRRRAAEFKADNRKFHEVRRLFYHPRITIMDVRKYVSHEHTRVELNDVCVYTTLEHTPESMILKNITVTAHKSEIIGMVGRTGAGKTTLLSVLQNIIDNRTGQVLLDGKDLNDIPKAVLRQIIGVLPQLPFVFKGWTVRRFLDPRKLFSDEEINDALDKCGLLEFVNGLPGGKKLDSVLVAEEPLLYYQKSKGAQSSPIEYSSMKFTKPGDESDMLLSNTQLRTLSLARLVLYRHFYRLIVVDEPPEEELAEEGGKRVEDLGVQIYDLLQKHFSHCTTFVTAHDVNVLKKCTYVWALHQGCLVRICKSSDIAPNESISKIIEESIKCS